MDIRIPYLHHTGVGLSLERHRIVLTEIVRLRDTVRVERVVARPVEDGRIADALKQLVNELGDVHPFVTTHIDSIHVRHHVLSVPPFDYPDERDQWIEQKISGVLPSSVSAEEFVVRYTITDHENGSASCLVGIVRKSVVESRCSIIREAGLLPVAVSTIPCALGHAYVLDVDFMAGPSWVLWNGERETTLIRYELGAPSAVHDVSRLSGENPRHLETALTTVLGSVSPARRAHIRLAGNLPLEPVSESAYIALSFLPPGGLGGTASGDISRASLTAAGLAMKQVFTGLPGLNFLSTEQISAVRQLREKSDTKSFARGVALLVAVWFVVVSIMNVGVNQLAADTRSALAARSLDVTQLEAEHAELARLETLLEGAQRVLQDSRPVTPLLDIIGSAVPQGLWLTELSIVEVNNAGLNVDIVGLANDDPIITSFLESLRSAEVVRDVRLVYTSRLSEEESARVVRTSSGDLVQFQILASTSPSMPASP